MSRVAAGRRCRRDCGAARPIVARAPADRDRLRHLGRRSPARSAPPDRAADRGRGRVRANRAHAAPHAMTGAPKAVWCTPHAYRSVARLGAHHLTARLAARGWDVLFLSNPISPLHALKWRHPDTKLRLSQALRGIGCEGQGLRTMLPGTVLPLAGRLGARRRWVLDHWPDFTMPNLALTLRRAGFDAPDLMVIGGPLGAPLIDIIKPSRSVLRLLDRLSGFASTTPA